MAPAPPPTIPSTHAGLDRFIPPPGSYKTTFLPSKEHSKPNFNYEWMHTLFRRSNFSFTGCYLNHKPQGDVTDDKRWLAVFPKFKEQGWGFLFIFLGYSYRADKDRTATNFNRRLTSEEAKDLGRNNARLLKVRMAQYGHEAQGAVVFFDNEDQQEKHPDAKPKPIPGDEPVSSIYVDYCAALFEECRRSGPPPNDGPAVRPGFYGWENPTQRVMLRLANSDIYLWRCNKMKENPPTPYDKVYDTKTIPGKLISPIERYPLNAIYHAVEKGPTTDPKDPLYRTSMIMGRQWIIYDGVGEGMPDGVKWLEKTSGFDFDAGLVRDPRYPIAEPRVAAVGDVQIRGFFSKEDVSMHLEQVYTTSRPVGFPTGGEEELLEPEAPILLTKVSSPELFTVNKSGTPVRIIGTATMDPRAPWDWSLPVKLYDGGSSKTRLRRNRAMVVTHNGSKTNLDTQIYFVSDNHSLVGMRRVASGPWSGPTKVAIDFSLHPFSSVAAASRGTKSVHLFYLDNEGLLCETEWLSSDKEWPGRGHNTLQKEPTLMLGGPIVAVSPSEDYVLVFGIGMDLMLQMAIYSANSNGWTQLAVVEGLQPIDHKLFAHAGLDACAYNESTVYVSSITEINEPCVYMLSLNAGKWGLRGPSDRLYLPNEPPEPPKKPTSNADSRLFELSEQDLSKFEGIVSKLAPPAAAVGYKFNPFGDVKLSVMDGSLMMWAPGVVNGGTKEHVTNTALLMKRVFNKTQHYWIKVN